VAWEQMADWQMVRRLDRGRYRIHGLVWDFARKKAESLPPAAQKRANTWVWDYPLRNAMPGWRWYRPSVPRPRGEPEWPWWDIRMPGGTGKRKLMWLADKVETFWHSGERVHLLASPAEWIVVARRRQLQRVCNRVMAVGIVLALPAAVLVKVVRPPAAWPLSLPLLAALLGVVAVVVVNLAFYFVATVDLRRIVWWWAMGRSFTGISGWPGSTDGTSEDR
jgi:hypothetical protein